MKKNSILSPVAHVLLSLLLVAGQARATLDHHVNRQLADVSSEEVADVSIVGASTGAKASKYSKSSSSGGYIRGLCGVLTYTMETWSPYFDAENRRIWRDQFIIGCSQNLFLAEGAEESCGAQFDQMDGEGQES